GFEDFLEIDERVVDETRARQGAAGHLAALLDVVEIDESIAFELRVHDDRLQRARLDARRGPARERLRCQHAAAQDAYLRLPGLHRQIAGGGRRRRVLELGDQKIAVRRERHVAWAREALGD